MGLKKYPQSSHVVEPEGLSFLIQEWADDDSKILRTRGGASSISAAIACYEVLVEQMPRSHLVLQQGGRVIRDSTEPRR